MNLVVLYMLILVTQLSLFTYGKSSPVADIGEILSSQLSNNGSYNDIKAGGGKTRSARNDRNFKIDEVLEKLRKCSGSQSSLSQLEATLQTPNCRTIECHLSQIIEYASEHCVNRKKRESTFDRDRRETFDQLSSDDLFLPVRGRRAAEQGSTHVQPEKKAKLDVLTNDLFVPNRGRRQLVRKNFLRLEPYPLIAFEKRNNIELDNMKDFFVPHRGKRQPTINDILSDNFLPQRGKKAIDEILSDNFFPQRGKKSATSIIIPKSNALDYHVPMDSQWSQNINPYDRRMIDRRLHDLNLLLLSSAEANKDITTAAVDGEKLQQMYGGGKMMIFNPLRNDEFTSDGTNLIFANTPIEQDDAPNDFTSRFI